MRNKKHYRRTDAHHGDQVGCHFSSARWQRRTRHGTGPTLIRHYDNTLGAPLRGGSSMQTLWKSATRPSQCDFIVRVFRGRRPRRIRNLLPPRATFLLRAAVDQTKVLREPLNEDVLGNRADNYEFGNECERECMKGKAPEEVRFRRTTLVAARFVVHKERYPGTRKTRFGHGLGKPSIAKTIFVL